jgi:hypothetical protein
LRRYQRKTFATRIFQELLIDRWLLAFGGLKVTP